MATQIRCPKCGYPNSADSLRCARCSAAFVQICPRCGTRRPHYVERCPHCEATVEDASAFTSLFQQAPTQRLHNRYIIRETLSTSQVSAVYRVLDSGASASPTTAASASLAVKEFSTVALFRTEERRAAEQAFRSAVEQWAHVQHPALPRIIETFAERDKHYVVFEMIEGWSLKRLLSEGRVRITPDLARNWGAQLCQLGAALHAQQPPLFLPFLTPGHVMVTALGEIKLVDLGLTHLFAPNTFGPYGSLRGYAAPELESGPPTPRSDIFAVGRLLYALLVGRLLEQGLAQQLTLRQAVPGIAAQLVKTIAQAAHRDPAQRFATMSALGQALWDEAAAPLRPLPEWMELAAPSRFAAPTPPRGGERNSAATTEGSMEALGFARDPRYGPEAQSAPPPPPPPTSVGQAKVSAQPRQFNLTDLAPAEMRRLVLTLFNTGDGEFVGRVTSHVHWLTAPDKVVHLPAGRQAKVLLTVRAAAVPSGRTLEPQALSVDSNLGRQWVGVSTEVASGPALVIEQPHLDFGILSGDEELHRPLLLSNAGRQPLSGQVSSRVPWLRVPQGDFRCLAGKEARVMVQLLPARLPQGEQTVPGALVVDSDGGQGQVSAHAWRQTAVLDLGATHMDFGAVTAGEVAERLLFVGNTGDAPLQGSARALLPWLAVHPQQFAVAPGEMQQLTVTADAVGLADGVFDVPQALRVQTNAGTHTLPLRLHVRAPRLALGTTQLSFGSLRLGETRELRLLIRNEGSAPLEAQLQSLADWLTLSESALTVAPGQETAVRARADTGRFARGQGIVLPAAVRIVAGASIAEVAASLTVLQPTLRVEPAEVDFGYIERAQPEQRTLLVANDGTGRLAWNAQSDGVWVEVTPLSGVCEAGEATPLTLTAYGLGLEQESDAGQATLIINSDGGRAKIPLRVALAAPHLACDTTLLELGPSINRQNVSSSFRLFNHGLGTLRGSITTDQIWLVVGRASFECPTGHSIEIPVSTDMAEFPAGENRGYGAIRIESNGGAAVVQITLNITLAPLVEMATDVVLLSRVDDEHPWQGRLTLRNNGHATAHIELRVNQTALAISLERLEIKPSKSARVSLQWPVAVAPPEEPLHVEARCGTQRLRVTVTWGEGERATP